jgi:DNA-binding GntR family transcriptional regulator
VPPERRILRDQVNQALRAALEAGELKPGAVYSAPVLAARFGVSATPVREAMLDLIKEGLVEAVPNKGFRVIEVTERDLAELLEIRALLEAPGTVLVARSASRAQLEALLGPARTGGDAGFHQALLTLTGNRHLVALVDELRRRGARCGGEAAGHERLVDLMLTRDLDGVEALMHRHLVG